jgi:hypothetical protein
VAFPATSDFTSPDLDAAWWYYARPDGHGNDICATNGNAFLSSLSTTLGVSDTAVWDATIQNALITTAQGYQSGQALAGWDGVVAQLQTDLNTQTISAASLAFALYVAYYARNQESSNSIQLTTNTVLPVWGQALPTLDSDWAGFPPAPVCWSSSDPNPINDTMTQYNADVAQSTYGWRQHPGDAAPQGTLTPPPGPGGVSTGVAIALGVGAAVLIGWAVYANSKVRRP